MPLVSFLDKNVSIEMLTNQTNVKYFKIWTIIWVDFHVFSPIFKINPYIDQIYKNYKFKLIKIYQ